MPKTARITFMTTPELKHAIEDAARTNKVSVGELIRERFAPASTALTPEQKELSALGCELKIRATAAGKSLRASLEEIDQALAMLRASRNSASLV